MERKTGDKEEKIEHFGAASSVTLVRRFNHGAISALKLRFFEGFYIWCAQR